MMKHGFLKVAAATYEIRPADVWGNTQNAIEYINCAFNNGAKLVVFPELCITGYTLGDLFLQKKLLQSAKEALIKIANDTENLDIIIVVGLPFEFCGKLYNCCAVLHRGKILGLVPKTYIPNYSEFYEARHFTPAPFENFKINIGNQETLFGKKLLFSCENMSSFVLGVEICEDMWAANPTGVGLALSGATVIANPSASDEVIGKDEYRRDLVRMQSGRLICGYVYANAGEGESTTDLIYSGHNLICEYGTTLAESKRFEEGIIYSEIDLERIIGERRRTTTFVTNQSYEIVKFNLKLEETKISRKVSKSPFVPEDISNRDKRCEDILTMQAVGLKKRLKHTGVKTAVIGISGGLDSTLALIATTKAFDMLRFDRKNIVAVTMPCFGTTDRTYNNAVSLCKELSVTLKEIPIKDAVKQHFKDIGQDENTFDVTFENSQARERTQVLMDLANKLGGLVIGTGDLSELALGWATYAGDHISMYGLNSSVPKTLVRHIISYAASKAEENLSRVLIDISDTPVSPELLPPKDGVISQETESLVGPYILSDFYLYYMIRFGFSPEKIYRLAKIAFKDEFDDDEILKWLKVFYKRFFSQQFKRSCLPDGPKIGSVTLSPRGDWRMPSDAAADLWLAELENIL